MRRGWPWWGVWVWLSACGKEPDPIVDADRDGVPADRDCDDGDALISPDRPEDFCDQRDNDCDPATADGPAQIRGRGTFATVEEALLAARGGDLIEICAVDGPLEVALDITVDVAIEGKEGLETTLKGSDPSRPVVRVSGPGATLRNLTVTGGAGGVDASAATGDLTLDRVTVERNDGPTGGVIGPALGLLALVDSAVHDNTGSSAGGGIRATGDVSLERSTVTGNSAPSGGGLWAGGAVTLDTTSEVSGNSAGRGGGAWLDAGASLTGGVVRDNVATELGGGLYLDGATATDVGIEGNEAPQGGGVAGSGDLVRCGIRENEADEGGGLYGSGDLGVDGGEVLDNVARVGDGGGARVVGGTLTIERSARFLRNEATGSGGAVSVHQGSLAVVTARFEENAAATGGGIHLTDVAASSITAADLVANDARGSGDGGGVWTDGPVDLATSTLPGNTAAEGGGIYVADGGRVTLSSVLLEANTARTRGGGLLVDSSVDAARLIGSGTVLSLNGAPVGGAMHVASGEAACEGAVIRDHQVPGNGAVSVSQAPSTRSDSRYESVSCTYVGNGDDDVFLDRGYDAAVLPVDFFCEWVDDVPRCAGM